MNRLNRMNKLYRRQARSNPMSRPKRILSWLNLCWHVLLFGLGRGKSIAWIGAYAEWHLESPEQKKAREDYRRGEVSRKDRDSD